NLQTGVRFFAEGSVADDRVTVYAHDRPLSETLQAVAGLFHDEWRRSGDSADRGYVLSQLPAQVEKEDKLRQERIREVADVILFEVRTFDKYESFSEARLAERSVELTRDLTAATDPARKRDLQIETGVVASLLGRSDWRKAV